MINSTSSKNYAKALAGLAEDKLMSYEDINKDLDIISKIIESSPDLEKVLENITISNDAKTKIIDEVFKNQVNDKVINFLKILIDKNKFNHFNSIKSAFKKILDEVNNIKRVEVISAITLTDTHKSKITEKLKNKLGKDIIANWVEQPEIIGGLIIKIEDDVIDSSLKNKLENLGIIK